MKKYIKIMRFDHWIKQLFILPGFICLIFLGKYKITNKIIIKLILALFATSLIASSNYIINEYLDSKTDKYHPIKKQRTLVNDNINKYIIWILWFTLAIIGLLVGKTFINKKFALLEIILLLLGFLYNVKPFRTKDIFILDVLSESANNAIRLLLGFNIIKNNIIPPISLVFGYWMCGAFLMTIKRYSEYLMINDKKIALNYRKSFKYYNEKRLLTFSFFYAMSSTFFIGIFLIKYKIELILLIPFFIILYCYYFYLSFEKDSVVQKPEKLYKEKTLMLYSIFLIILFMFLMNISIPWLEIFYK